MRKILFLSFLLVCAGCVTVVAQDRKITGKVTSAEDGSALPGVSVVVKGTSKGVNTDGSGSYSIDAPNSATLVFSFVGTLTQEIAVGTRTAINVVLAADTKQLSEVVVTAVGIQRDKKALAFAVSNVKGSDLQQRSEPDPLRALSGKVPGVNITAGNGAPGAGTRITIRGNNSFTGNNQPLFVVDGIPFDNGVNSTQGYNQNTVTSNRAYDIDPNNIESMTVLKGAAASALYGSRAANGVIVITTKAGSKSARKGLEVTYNSSYSVENVSSLPEYQDSYTQGSNQTYNGGFIGNWGTAMPDAVDRINAGLGFERYSKVIDPDFPAGTIPHPLVDATVPYGAARFQAAFPELMQANGRGIAVPLKAYDIVGAFFRQGKVLENGIQINSTGDKTSINASMSRTKNEGIVPNSSTERTTLSFGGNATLVNGLNVSGSVAYTRTNQMSPQSGAGYYADYGGLASAGSIYSRLFYLPRNYDLGGYPFENPVDGSNVFYRALDNPLWTAKYNLYNSSVNRAYGNMALSYDVTPWLNLTARGGLNTYSEIRRNTIRPGGTFQPLGSVLRQDLTNTEVDFTFLATAQHDFSEKINAKLLVGFNPNERSYSESGVSGSPVIDANVLTTAATLTQTAYEFSRKRRLYGVFSELTLGYSNYLFLTASARQDRSSTLPAANNTYLYPAISASFIFTDAFNLPKNIINFGKIRANYAKVGKDADPYQVNTAYNLSRTFYNATAISTASLPSQLNNATLRPEFTSEIELGTELQFLNNRIGVDLAYFNRNSTDLIVTRQLPNTTGFNTEITNAGKISNKGWELGLTLVPVKLRNGFKWTSFVAYTRIRSKVEDAGPGGEIFIGGTGLSALGTIFRNGLPYGQIYGSVNARDENGNLLINPNTGLPIRAAGSTIIGDPNTKYTVGWTNTISFKGFNLNILIDYKAGGSLFSSTAASLLLRGQLKNSEDREGMRVIPGVLGDPTTYKPLLGDDGKPIKNTIAMSAFQYHFSDGYGAYGSDEVNIYDASVIRIREVSLGYEVPKTFLKKYAKVFGGLRLSASGRNLWFYAPNMLPGLNFDPEILSNFSDSNIQGFDLGASPSTRRFGINLTATF
ncbi:SusC/RagA family TonB-linked outer membrane protein [Runella sp.]|uniref:SusC/RagA family TonB-linked outer membrane protein n=1 Tax=Runella sp. TaxID=1960881 RepID=UPI003018AD31